MTTRESFLLFVVQLSLLSEDQPGDRAFQEATHISDKTLSKIEKQIPEAAFEFVQYFTGNKPRPAWLGKRQDSTTRQRADS